jgi:chromatin segregation and condensation protein Rec8/ScpA/Scc1 (kleisin family)
VTEEENILKVILEKESWEEILYNIVSLEQLNPWDVDLVKLTGGFLKFIREAQELDFRIPAKIVFIVAVLLRLKSDNLSIFEEQGAMEEAVEKQKEMIELGVDPNLIQLGLPMKRMPKRQVTIDELVTALRKALDVREKKVERHRLWKERLNFEMPAEEDITKRIENVMSEIETALQKSKKGIVNFKDLVEWNRESVVQHFVPLLHLEQDRKIDTHQEELFKEILISKRVS